MQTLYYHNNPFLLENDSDKLRYFKNCILNKYYSNTNWPFDNIETNNYDNILIKALKLFIETGKSEETEKHIQLRRAQNDFLK